MATIVKRNTPIPCRRTDTFTTEEDGQTAVDIVIYEGERASTDACNELGKFTIHGIERAKRWVGSPV
jgi:L1 cell adhesion molecule like protein